MLTSRGWWFLLIVLALLGVAVLAHLSTLVFLALTLALWFAWEWLLFAVRIHFAAPRVTLTREIHDEHGRVDTLWAGQSFQVHVTVRLRGTSRLAHAAISDRVPFGLEHTAGEVQVDGPLGRGRQLELTYRVLCPAVGRARFEGVRLQLADLQGFFQHTTFLRGVIVCRVLPVLADAEGQPATTKRHNLLPPPGIHRLHRAGSGSELLDLRDYLPGDPPKTIAWKVSARRDRLITKEFESEVPVRCTLFVDTSNSVRVGPRGGNALTRLIDVAAAVAQANTTQRDLTGLCLFDEERATWVRPARTRQHLAQMLNLLVDAAGLAPSTGKATVDTLLPVSYAFAQEVYPREMHAGLNYAPPLLPWLWPLPKYPGKGLSVFGAAYRVLFLIVGILSFFLNAVCLYAFLELLKELMPHFLPPVVVFVPLVLLWAPYHYKLFAHLARVLPQALSFRRRREIRWRKRLAALLSVHQGLAPGGLGYLMEDNDRFSLAMQRFLADHHIPYLLPFYDAQGRYLFAAPGKIDVLTRSLLQAITKGHDNELFVLLADVLELPERLDPLLRAVRVALARHHHVLLICPWPPGVPPPRGETRQGDKETRRQGDRRAFTTGERLWPVLQQTTTERFHRAFLHVRQAFARLGVPVIGAQSGESVRLILDRLDRLRTAGRRR